MEDFVNFCCFLKINDYLCLISINDAPNHGRLLCWATSRENCHRKKTKKRQKIVVTSDTDMNQQFSAAFKKVKLRGKYPGSERYSQGTILPGFSMLFGSKASFTLRINSICALSIKRGTYSTRFSPTPCSPVSVPPNFMTTA